MCSCYNQRVVIAFVACETQDFASLLISVSVIKGWIMMCYYNGVCQQRRKILRLPRRFAQFYSYYNWHVVIAFVASPEVVSAIYPCYNQRVVIAFVACETQDFASLLNMLRFLVLCFLVITLFAALFVYASFAPPQYEKSYGAQVARHRCMEHSVTYVPY